MVNDHIVQRYFHRTSKAAPACVSAAVLAVLASRGDGSGPVQNAFVERGFLLPLIALLEPPGDGEIGYDHGSGGHRDELHRQGAGPDFHFCAHAASGSIAKM